jgi:heme A synthase
MPSRYACRQPRARRGAGEDHGLMVGILILAVIVGIVLILLGVFVDVVQFLLYVGILILLIALIAWLMRIFRRNA